MSIRDFKAKQLRTSKIIASGSNAGAEPSILIYSASAATNTTGGAHADLLTNVGTDVFLFVSGSKTTDSNGNIAYSDNSANRVDTAVFGGDLVVSGVLYAEVLRAEVDMATTGSLSVEGPLMVSGSAEIGPMGALGSNRGKLTIANVAGDGPDDALTIYNHDTASDAIQVITYATTGTGQRISAAALTTGVGLQVLGGGNSFNGKVAEIDYDGTSTSAHTVLLVSKDDANGSDSNAIVGLDIDFNMTDGTAGRALRIDSEQTTGQVVEIDAKEVTSGVGLRVNVDDLTSGHAVEVRSTAASSRTDALIQFEDTSVNVNAANEILKIQKTNSLLSDTNAIVGLDIDFDGQAGTAGRAMRIDSEQTTGIVAEIDGNEITTGAVLVVSGNSVATTGQVFKAVGQNEETLISLGQTAGNGRIPQAVFLSSSAVPNLDVSFFVSGSTGDSGKDKGGVALFGGDVHVSGTLFAEVSFPGDLTVGDDIFLNSDGAVIHFGEHGEVTLTHVHNTGLLLSDESGIGTTKLSFGDNSTYVQQQEDGILKVSADTLLRLDGAKIELSGTQGVGVSHDFRAQTNNKYHALFVDSTADKVLILSGGAPTSMDEASAGDVGFYVSGSVGHKGSTHKGTAVFGGDTVVSGAVFVGGSLNDADSTAGHIVYEHEQDKKIRFYSAGIDILAGTGGTGAGGEHYFVSIADSGQKAVNINALTEDIDFTVQSDVGTALKSHAETHQLSLGDGNAPASDTFLFVSGNIGSKDSSYLSGSSVFGGDVVVSGGLYLEERAAPGAIADGTVVLYSKDDGGVTKLYFKNESGETEVGAGTLQGIDDQSSSNDDQITITDTAVIINEDSDDLDFRVESNNREHAIFVNGGTDQVLVLSGSSSDDPFDEATGADVAFYVSGTVGSRGTSERGTSLFGGDVAISGSLFVGQLDVDSQEEPVLAVDYEDKRVGIGTSSPTYALDVVRSDGTLYDATTDYTGGDGQIRVRNTFGTVKSSTGIIFSNSSDGATSGLLSTVDPEQSSGADVIKVILDAHRNDGVVIRGKRGTRSHNQVLILSGGSGNSFNEAAAADVAFYVSGAIGSAGTAVRGTSVFGGDVVISGTLKATAISGSLTHLQDGTSYLIAGSNVTITTGSNGAVTIASTATGGGGGAGSEGWIAPTNQVISTTGSLRIGTADENNPDIDLGSDGSAVFNEQGASVDFRVESDNKTHAIFVDGSTNQVLILSGGAESSLHATNFADTNFFVSGAIGSRGTASRGTSVFGGDMFVSGGMVVGEAPTETADGSLQDFIVNTKDAAGIINVSGQNNYIQFRTSDSSGQLSIGQDTFFHVSGAIGKRGSSEGETAVFGGDVVVSGALHTEQPVSIVHNSTSTDTLLLTTADDGSTAGPILSLKRNSSSPANADYLGQVKFKGENDNDEEIVYAKITGKVGDKSDGAEDGIIEFATKNAGSSEIIARIKNSGLDVLGAVSGSTVETGLLFSDSGDLTIQNQASDKDIVFKVNHGGSDTTMLTMDADIPVIQTADGIRQSFGSPNSFISGSATPGKGLGLAIKSNKCIWISGSQGVFFGKRIGTGNQDQGNDSGVPASIGNDTAFFVSGTISSQGTSDRGTAVFGGDVVISGTLHGEDIHVGESIFHSGDTDTKIVFADNAIGITVGGEQLITVTEAGQDIVKIGDGGDVDFQVRTDGDDNTLYVQGSSDRVGIGTNSPASVLHIKESAPTLSLQRESNSNDSTVAFLGASGFTGAIMHLSKSNDLVFKTHDGTSPHEILRLGGHYSSDVRQVILLSGSDMGTGAMQPKEAADINFFVSGAVGKRGTSERGTAVFGGDLVTSGTTHALGALKAEFGLSGSLTQLSDGTSYIKAGSNITITSASNGAITIASTGGGGSGGGVGFIAAANNIISTTGSLYFGTSDSSNPDINLGSDGSAVFNEQSNSVDFRIESNDLSHMVFVDGSANQVSIGAPSSDITSDAKLVISSSTNNTLLTLNANSPDVARTTSIMSVLSGSAYVFNLDKQGKAWFNPDFANESNPTVPADVTFFVSGSSNVSDRHTASGGVTLFGGNVVLSGSVIPGLDSAVDLGSSTNRFRNVYTGDLHLRNDRGDWTILEERDYLCVVNNITGKKYKMDLTPLDE